MSTHGGKVPGSIKAPVKDYLTVDSPSLATAEDSSGVGSAANAALRHVTVTLGRELFRFDSFQQWVNKAQSWFMRSGVPSSQVLCVDATGRICSMGKQIGRAHV